MKLEGYDNYEIFPETGQVWSYNSNRYIGMKNEKGYWICYLSKNNKRVKWRINRLVWTVVNGEIPEGMEVNHNDENKDNNSIFNLSLMTHKENINWGTRTERASKNMTNGKKSKAILGLTDGEISLYFPSAWEADRNGYAQGNISSCARGVRQIAYGYQWQYVDDYLANWWDTQMVYGELS